MKSFFCVHWSSHLYLPSSQPSSQHVRWPDVFVPLVINLEADESMCNWLCKAFNPCVFNRHSYLCYRFLQKLFDLWFRCITTESCYYSFALILVVMGSVGFVVSVFISFTHVGDCLFHIRDYFLDLFVSVIAFFLHFRHGCVHSMELGSDWIVNCLHEMFLSCYLRILSQHQFSRQVTSCLVTEPSWLRTMVPTLSIPWTFFNDETTNVTKKKKKQRSCYIPRTVQPRQQLPNKREQQKTSLVSPDVFECGRGVFWFVEILWEEKGEGAGKNGRSSCLTIHISLLIWRFTFFGSGGS